MKIFIMGMHRSGTSLVTGLLHKCGLYLGNNLLMGAKDNPTGHFEDRRFINLNNQLLISNGGTWRKPPAYIEWNKKIILKIHNFIDSFPENKIVGFKDPRICITFPVWYHLIEPEPIEVVFVHRPASEIASSLKKRNNMPISMGLKLAKTYLERANRALQDAGIEPHEVYFHDFFKPGWKVNLCYLCSVLGLEYPINHTILTKFVDERLWHHREGAA